MENKARYKVNVDVFDTSIDDYIYMGGIHTDENEKIVKLLQSALEHFQQFNKKGGKN
ncbi:MAG: hypothetical protein GY820_38525 [Gammaproteobacteria bacterium]|nr:hypothetical protein [Gammaproteobacteria bacterium]